MERTLNLRKRFLAEMVFNCIVEIDSHRLSRVRVVSKSGLGPAEIFGCPARASTSSIKVTFTIARPKQRNFPPHVLSRSMQETAMSAEYVVEAPLAEAGKAHGMRKNGKHCSSHVRGREGSQLLISMYPHLSGDPY